MSGTKDGLHLFEEATPVVFENKVRVFLYSTDFSDDGLSLSAQIQEKDIRLDEETWEKLWMYL